MNAFSNFLGPLLGLGYEAKDLTFVQISLRAVIVFLATLGMVRLGHKRVAGTQKRFRCRPHRNSGFLSRAGDQRHLPFICHDRRGFRRRTA